jgi:DNA polymerase III delta prime subunit
MSSENTDTIPWVEKYRPSHFENIVLDPTNREFFNKIVKTGQFPNLMFYGPPGTGKTTTIINLIRQFQDTHGRINKSNVIHLNASDERGIDIIRNQIHSFVRTMNLFESGFKFVILDEVDYMTKNAQQALKYLLQTTTTKVRFCLICNYISKIDEPLKNEFICVRFNQLPTQDIHKFIQTIANKENIPITHESIQIIQTMYRSDIRSMINFLQLNQNFQLEEWNRNILNDKILEELHENMCSKQSHNVLKQFMHRISTAYNKDKKHIINAYLNYIIRNNRINLTPEFMNMLENVIHSSNAVMDDILYYMSTSDMQSTNIDECSHIVNECI